MSRVPLSALCAVVELLVLDVDGVLTEGGIVYGSGELSSEIKAFHVRDGSGLKLWHRAGKRSAVITGRSSQVVERRARELGVSRVVQGVEDKAAALDEVLAALGVSASSTCFVGDDLPDLGPLGRVGLPAAVADACPEVRLAARYITLARGGRGAVREVIERILRCQGLFSEDRGQKSEVRSQKQDTGL